MEQVLEVPAQRLVATCSFYAVPLITTLSVKFPVLDNVDREHWDFIVTVAGVFIATSRLEQLGLTDKQKTSLLEIIVNDLQEWKSDGLRAIDNCKTLFEREFDELTARGHEERYTGSDALGMWIIVNVLGHGPQNKEEVRLLRTVGAMVTATFFDYWSRVAQT